MDALYFIAILSSVSTVVFLPFLCWLDIRTRNIHNYTIGFYLGTAIISPIALYLTGLPLTYLLISLAMCGIWVLIRKTGAWGGADTKFLMVFSLCCPLNPLNLYQQTFQISFLIILGAVMLVTAAIEGQRKDLPMMVPISVAIVLTMITGILL